MDVLTFINYKFFHSSKKFFIFVSEARDKPLYNSIKIYNYEN